jgi:prepilin-type N-terminal cleavage/methylation domain-containing protein
MGKTKLLGSGFSGNSQKTVETNISKMNRNQLRSRSRGFTLVELLVVVLILETILSIAIPSYISSVYSSRMGIANANAKALATAAQGKAIIAGAYDTVLADYATDMGGTVPVNPCTGTTTGFTITDSGTQCNVVALAGTNCGSWTPVTFVLGYSGG